MEYFITAKQPSDDIVKLTRLLEAQGIPVAQYVPKADGSGYHVTKITGTHPDLFEQPRLATEFGRQLGRLHIALTRVESQFDNLRDNNFLEQWHNYVLPGLGDEVPAHMHDEVGAKLAEICPKLPHQLIHRDVHCQNVLFNNGRLVGWIDFDLYHRNARIFDMAYLLAGLIVGNQHNPEKVDTWRRICDLFMVSYNEVNPLTVTEKNALPLMMTAIELLFVSFWNGEGNVQQRDAALDLAKWLWNQTSMKMVSKVFVI